MWLRTAMAKRCPPTVASNALCFFMSVGRVFFHRPRELGAAGHYPAIQIPDSVSRLQSKLATNPGVAPQGGHAS
jgi:hypothetical protein